MHHHRHSPTQAAAQFCRSRRWAIGRKVAGALGEMKRYILKREYPEIDKEDIRVILVEGTDRLLRTMSERASADALTYLGHLMIETRLNCMMESYDDNIVRLSNGEEIYCETLIWTAGITGSVIKGLSPDCITKGQSLHHRRAMQNQGLRQYLCARRHRLSRRRSLPERASASGTSGHPASETSCQHPQWENHNAICVCRQRLNGDYRAEQSRMRLKNSPTFMGDRHG